MRDIPYNVKLKHMGKSQTKMCQLCPSQREMILHLYCPKRVELWDQLRTIFLEVYAIDMKKDVVKDLFGNIGGKTDRQLAFIRC